MRLAPLLVLLPAVAAASAQAGAEAPPPIPPAEAAPATRAFRYSPYEEETIAAALGALGLEPEPAPEGKRVEAVHTVRLEVIEERDPAPRFLNAVHVVSRPGVIAREVQLAAGAPWRQTFADETRRRLSALPQLSLVLVVAARGSSPETVQAVVVTKDVWSLRLNWDAAVTASGFESITINPSETNFLGTHHTAGLSLAWLPRSYAVGARYLWPRVGGTQVNAAADAGLSFDGRSGAREGSFGDLGVSQPLFSSRSAWSWGVSGGWLSEVTRRYRGGELAYFRTDPAVSCPAAGAAACLPDAYRTEIAAAGASVTRSRGWARKLDLTFGVDARRSRFRLPEDAAGAPADLAEAYRRQRLPVSEDRVGPLVQLRTYSSDFVRVLDLETVALQEDHRLGADAYLRVYPLLRALGSSHDLVGISAGLGDTLALGDGLARAAVESITELRTGGGRVSDGSLLATARLASPRFRFGRLVLDGFAFDRWANAQNHASSLGGDGRLRGFPTGSFLGRHAVALNAELRSRPWQVLGALQVAGVLFHDLGDAFDAWRDLRLRGSAGGGLRFLFPQLDRFVFRVDVGVPLAWNRPAGVAPVGVFATFGQAFPLYELAPRTAVSR